MRSLSIVVPTLHEGSTIAACLTPLQPRRGPGVEVIVVDGGSADDTLAQADRLADQVLSAGRAGRAHQMNLGWRQARGEVVAFVHADTRLDGRHVAALRALPRGRWGRFDLRLSGRRPIFRLIERLITLRSRLTAMATGDQVLFAERTLLETLGGYPEVPLMEDLELCLRLRRWARYTCLGPPVVTSSRRWERDGVWRTVFLMWRLRFAWWLGVDHAELARRYRHAR